MYLPDGPVSFDGQSNWNIDCAAQNHIVQGIYEVAENCDVEVGMVMSTKDLSNAQNQEKCVAAGQVCQNEVEEAYQLITETQKISM